MIFVFISLINIFHVHNCFLVELTSMASLAVLIFYKHSISGYFGTILLVANFLGQTWFLKLYGNFIFAHVRKLRQQRAAVSSAPSNYNALRCKDYFTDWYYLSHRELESDLRSYYSQGGYVYTELDSLYLDKRCASLKRIQEQVMDVITHATVIEDTIEEIKKLKVSVENLSADVNMLNSQSSPLRYM